MCVCVCVCVYVCVCVCVCVCVYDATIQCPENEIEGEMDGEGGAHLTLI